MALHALVAMPFGVKDGIDFDHIYTKLIHPALETAGFEAFRSDEEISTGALRKNLFQELLLADLVIVDISIETPNLWYQLGVRQALRARGVAIISCREKRLPFDIAPDRVLRYHHKNGEADPDTLTSDRAALTHLVDEATQRWHSLQISPVYHALPNLQEPNWKSLKVADANEFWEYYENWRDRFEVARKRNRSGDILVLAEETPTWALRLEARRLTGKTLLKQGHYSLALEQFESALAIDPADAESLCNIGVILSRLNKHDEAEIWLRDIVERHSDNAECWFLFGQMQQTEWVRRWHVIGNSRNEMRLAAAAQETLLRQAIESYRTAFRIDPRHYCAGINALTLCYLLRHLDYDDSPFNARALEGGVRWACLAALQQDPRNYWARASLAELETLVADRPVVVHAYRHAIAVERDWFALDALRQQLMMLRNLDFRPDIVKTALEIYQHELALVAQPTPPRQAILFSGDMIEASDRREPHFPINKERNAAKAIAAMLEELNAGAEDVALCGGAYGGDLLFAEACLSRNVPLTLHLALPEPAFIQRSVAVGGGSWVERYYAVKENSRVQTLVAPAILGPAPRHTHPFSRNNLWMLFTTLAYGAERARFIRLSNGRTVDGSDGIKNMMERMNKHSPPPYTININQL